MTISIKLHKLVTTQQVCVVTIKDSNNNIVVNKANIGLELNPDETANTAWIEDTAKKYVLNYQHQLLANNMIIIDSE
jgi:hypothetical protein